MKKLFALAAAATCLFFSAGCSRNDSTPENNIKISNDQILDHRWQGDGYIGPGTSKFYTPEQIKALRDYAGVPVAVFSSDDKPYLSNPNDYEGSMQQISTWLQGSGINTETFLRSIYFDIVYRASVSQTIPVYTGDSNGADIKYMGAVVTVPGSSFDVETLQAETSVKFNKGLIDNNLMNEIRLGAAAHEFSHALNFNRKNASESDAELGEFKFITLHPEFFPTLRDKTKFQSYVINNRAFDPLETQWHTRYGQIAFCSMAENGCPVTLSTETASAGDGIMRKASEFIYGHNLLPEPSNINYLSFALRHFRTSKADARQFYLTEAIGKIFDQPICITHDSPCHNTFYVADAKNPLLNSFVAVIERLNNDNAFAGSSAAIYASNLVAAGDLYLDKNSLTKARADVLAHAPARGVPVSPKIPAIAPAAR